jgi:RNA polymerase sigma factor (sigma-70 family)
MTEAAADWVLATTPAITARTTSRDRGRSAVAAELYRELAPAVLGYLRSQRVPDPDDVLGEVFLHVARDVHRVRGGEERRRRWVFTVAHHRLVDEWRRRATRPPIVDGAMPDVPAADDPVSILDVELQRALDALTDDQRTVVLLRFVADLSILDVARITGRRVGAVKALQHRGLDRLERVLNNAP